MKQGMVTITNNLAQGAKMVNTLTKLGSAATSVVGMAADVIDGTRDLGSQINQSAQDEIKTLSEERRIENAVNRLLMKADGINKIREAFGCSLEQAEELLRNEIDNYGEIK